MAKEKTLQCSFCLKTSEEVRMIVSGAKATICDECIENAASIIKQELGFDNEADVTSAKKTTGVSPFNYKQLISKNISILMLSDKMMPRKYSVWLFIIITND